MRRMLAVMGALALLAGACGSDSDDTGGSAGDGPRTVEIAMRDIEFEPGEVAVAKGETVRFVFENEGKLAHDAFVGDRAAQDEHETEMREAEEAGEAEHGHEAEAEAGGISVDPGKRGELTHRFDETGEVLIGCHEPGHYEAGMVVKVTVS